MITSRTSRLIHAMVLVATGTVTTMSLIACNEAKFGGKSVPGAGNLKDGKYGPNDRDGLGGENATAGVDANAYGTPVTDDLGKPGWTDDKLKPLVDTLFRTGSIPTLGGDNPGSGGSTGTGSGIPGLGGSESNGNGPGNGGDNGDNNNGSLFSDSSGVLWLPCSENGAKPAPFSNDFFAKVGSKVRVAGEFCPQAKLGGEVTVVYVIDHSGSMEGTGPEGPNDKTNGGTCGRMKAAEVIAQKFAAMPDTNVKAAVVNFSGASRVDLPVGPLAALNAYPDKSKLFCGSDPKDASTNYNAAFSETKNLIANIPGKKLVYFISDGSPTSGGSNGTSASAAGLSAAQALRQVKDVTLFALFVGYTKGNANNPQGYLEQVTGDPKAVRVTANATELVQAAAALAQPIINISAKDVVAQVKTDKGVTDVKIDKIDARKDAINRYYWVTEPFELTGVAGKSQVNELSISAQTSTGEKVSAVTEINFNASK